MIVLAAVVTVSLLSDGPAGASDFVFLRSAKNGVSRLSRAEARAVYTGKTKNWPNGEVVQVVLTASGSPEMKWLAESVIGISESALRTKIKQESFKGEMKSPVAVSSVQECIAELKSNPGAICAASAADAGGLPAGIATIAYSGD
jgi:ABC-type phosphate transport system substrate-binding protein